MEFELVFHILDTTWWINMCEWIIWVGDVEYMQRCWTEESYPNQFVCALHCCSFMCIPFTYTNNCQNNDSVRQGPDELYLVWQWVGWDILCIIIVAFCPVILIAECFVSVSFNSTWQLFHLAAVLSTVSCTSNISNSLGLSSFWRVLVLWIFTS